MAYDVIFGTCTDPKNKVNKSLSTTYSASCTLIEPCDMLHPTLKLQGAFTNANMFILNGRWYHIIGISVNNGSTYITGNVDALSSWAGNIYGSTQFVTRTASDYDKYIPISIDTEIKPICEIHSFGSTFGNSLDGSDCYMIGVI